MTVAPKSTLAGYTADEVNSIVATRSQEMAELLGWSLAPPAIQLVDPMALAAATKEDVRARTEKIRGKAREQGFWAGLAQSVLQLFGPSVLGYFAAGNDTLYLNAELVPAQAGYVLVHELTHAAQWQNYPELFAAIDAARVAAEDAQDKHGDDARESKVARDRYESLVTFIEGHATMMGRKACTDRLTRDAPNASRDEIDALVTALIGLDLSDETTQLIYVRGELTVSSLLPARREELFRDPEAIVALFTRAAS